LDVQDILSAGAESGTIEPHTEVRFKFPPADHPDGVAVERSCFSDAEHQPGTFTFIADVGLDDVTAFRCWTAVEDVDDDG